MRGLRHSNAGVEPRRVEAAEAAGVVGSDGSDEQNGAKARAWMDPWLGSMGRSAGGRVGFLGAPGTRPRARKQAL